MKNNLYLGLIDCFGDEIKEISRVKIQPSDFVLCNDSWEVVNKNEISFGIFKPKLFKRKKIHVMCLGIYDSKKKSKLILKTNINGDKKIISDDLTVVFIKADLVFHFQGFEDILNFKNKK